MTAPVIVVGGGIAGLSVALGLGECIVLTRPGAGSSELAQGGIAAVVDPADDPADHAADTLRVSGGIGDPAAASTVTAAAAERIAWLVDLGARFDRDPTGRLTLGREAGHGRRRIVHATGDATGAEVMRALEAAVADHPDITVLEGWELVDLAVAGDGVAGVVALDRTGEPVVLPAAAVVLATGGLGAAYLRTTNPPEVTGDGLAVAARAGVTLADLEFVQFHPTALAVDADPVPLLTEALRGEGAILVDETGHRFMPEVHPDAELAPRDIVARAIAARIAAGHAVFLDATRAVGEVFPTRFPTVWASARRAGIDPRVEPLPVTPTEHYHMGGIATDLDGRTSLPGLWAVGEVGCTGLHGANRLASNSLLEGMVLGARAAVSIRTARRDGNASAARVPQDAFAVTRGDDPDTIRRLRTAMWERVGIVRDDTGLRSALATFAGIEGSSLRTRNLPLVGRLIAGAALARTESRGAHFRADHPHPDPTMAHRSFVTPVPAPTRTVALRRWSAA